MEKRNIWPIGAGLLTGTALSFTGVYQYKDSIFKMVQAQVDGVGLDKLIVLLAVCVLYVKVWEQIKQVRHWTVPLLACLFSAFMMIGISYSQNGNWNFIFGGKKQFCIALVVFAGYFFLFFVCVKLIYRFADRVSLKENKAKKPFPQWVEKHYPLFCALVIFLGWLPFLLAFLPGSVPHDGYNQLNMAFGVRDLTNQHSWSLTLLVGLIMRIGQVISDNFGVFLVVISFCIVEVFCYAVVCKKIREWGAPRLLQMGTLAFFAINPVFGSYAQAILKDTIYLALYTLYTALYVEVCLWFLRRQQQECGRRLQMRFLQLFFLGFLISAFRNNGIFLVLPASLLLFFFCEKGYRRYALLLTFCLALCFGGYKYVLTPAAGVIPENKRVTMSVLFQQTARYVKEYPDEVTEEEKKAIDKVLDFDTIAENYDPELSDPVKDTFKIKATSGELQEYFRVWAQMFQKHPGVYLQATLHNTFGYYYPFSNRNARIAYHFYIKGAPVATGDFAISYVTPYRLRSLMEGYAELWRRVPGLAQLLNPGTYTWILLLMAGYFFYRKRYLGILVLAAPALNVAVCLASPVNGLLRYAMPVMACLPVLLYWCLEWSHASVQGPGRENTLKRIR